MNLLTEEIYLSIDHLIDQSYNPPIREIKPDIFLQMGEKLQEIDTQPRVTFLQSPSIPVWKIPSSSLVSALGYNYEWIERLLTIPCPDCRYYLTWQLFMPFFVNIKKYDLATITKKLKQWYVFGGDWNEHNVLNDSWIRSQYNTQRRKRYHFLSEERFDQEFEIINNKIVQKKDVK